LDLLLSGSDLEREFSQVACLTGVMGLELFLSFPREKPFLTRERELA
jgi:hypothetical protein